MVTKRSIVDAITDEFQYCTGKQFTFVSSLRIQYSQEDNKKQKEFTMSRKSRKRNKY